MHKNVIEIILLTHHYGNVKLYSVTLDDQVLDVNLHVFVEVIDWVTLLCILLCTVINTTVRALYFDKSQV